MFIVTDRATPSGRQRTARRFAVGHLRSWVQALAFPHPSRAGSQRLMSLTMPLVEGLEAFFLGLSALGLRASLFDFF